MADNIVTANPGAGGALFAVDLVSGTSTPFMKIATSSPVNIIGSISVTNTATVQGTLDISAIAGTSRVFGQVSSFPISTTFVTISSSQVALGGGTQYLDNSATTAPTGMMQMYKAGAANSTMVAVSTSQPLPTFIASSIALGFTPTGTSYVTIASSQVSIGGGQQYADGTGTSVPIGNVQMWKSGAANSTMTAVASSTPLPVFAISTNAHAISGTTQVNIVSSVALGFTPTGTSMVNVVSSNTLAPLNLISSTVFADNGAFVPGTSRLGVVGGYYVSTAPALAHSDAGAMLLNASSQVVIAPGSAEGFVSTQAVVFTAVVDANGNPVTSFGSGTQYVNNAATSQPTGMVQMWASGAANSTMVAVASSRPLPMNIVSSIALGFTPTGTSFVTLSSSQVAIGGGTQYVEGNTTTNPTGNVMIWKSAASTMSAVSSSQPLPMNIVSTITQTVTGQVSTFANNVVSTFINNVASTFTTGGTTAVNPISQGGLDTVWYPSVTTAPRTIKNSAGRLYDIWFTNTGTSTRWVGLFNASSAVVSTGTTLPLMRFGLPGGTSAVSGWLGSAMGYQFSTAISVSVTASSGTSSDTSAPGTNEVLLMFGYK